MDKFVIKVPSESLIKINQWALKVMSGQLHDKMNKLRFIEFSLLCLYFSNFNLLFGQIDKSLLWINVNHKHKVLLSDLEKFLNILNSLFGSLRG